MPVKVTLKRPKSRCKSQCCFLNLKLFDKTFIISHTKKRYADQITDVQNEIFNTYFEKDEARKKEMQEKINSQTLPNNLKWFNERISKTGSGFLSASGLSWADLHLFNMLEYLGDKKEPLLANYKFVKAMDEKIRANPNIAAWLAKRPKTEF